MLFMRARVLLATMLLLLSAAGLSALSTLSACSTVQTRASDTASADIIPLFTGLITPLKASYHTGETLSFTTSVINHGDETFDVKIHFCFIRASDGMPVGGSSESSLHPPYTEEGGMTAGTHSLYNAAITPGKYEAQLWIQYGNPLTQQMLDSKILILTQPPHPT